MVTDRSLLIMVDHSKTALTLSKGFYQEFQQIIVLTITVGMMISIMFWSPILKVEQNRANWLWTDSVQKSKKNRLTKIQASVLMAGIMLDTKNFSHVLQVGPLMWQLPSLKR